MPHAFAPQPSAAARGYDHEWLLLRRRHIRDEPDCRACAFRGVTRRAHAVDHVIPVRVAPHRRLDPTNLQSLCRSCHERKTAADRVRYRNGVL
jgi:5-methylcytosine-specific restriction endonuclease McrA